MEAKDLYKILGVSKGATQEEIRKSYRKLARKYHPDANRDDPEAENRFKEIQHAYEILSNPEKRREYDEVRVPSSARKAPAEGVPATRP
jgi:molecular chaperone DnaJ